MSSDRKFGLCYKPFAAETGTPAEDWKLKETNSRNGRWKYRMLN
jgi:hypothetical protein